MSGRSKIEWTDATWNPVTGCSPVSPGCDHCYAARMAKRLAGRAGYDAEEPFGVTIHNDRMDEPLRWKKPRRIFAMSMGDLFHPYVPEADIDRVFAVMAIASWHTFFLLTKRPARMRDYCASDATTGRVAALMAEWAKGEPMEVVVGHRDDGLRGLSLNNCWLGVTAEDQARADERIPILLDTPAAVRFVSVEPCLGPVDLDEWLCERAAGDLGGALTSRPMLDWVICGGESGPGARPMHPEWARSLRDQCVAAEVPFFFKQWGEWVPPDQFDAAGFDDVVEDDSAHYWPGGEMSWFVGKKRAGRLLDDEEWSQYPEVRR